MPVSNAPRGAVDYEKKAKPGPPQPQPPPALGGIHPIVAIAIGAIAAGTGLLSWWATRRVEERQDEIEATELKDWLPVFPGGGQLPLPKVLRQPELLWAILRNSGARPKKPG